MPFLADAASQKARAHLCMGIAESSKIVPTRTVYCFLQSRHRQRNRAFRLPVARSFI